MQSVLEYRKYIFDHFNIKEYNSELISLIISDEKEKWNGAMLRGLQHLHHHYITGSKFLLELMKVEVDNFISSNK